jgi:hypothetical protein
MKRKSWNLSSKVQTDRYPAFMPALVVAAMILLSATTQTAAASNDLNPANYRGKSQEKILCNTILQGMGQAITGIPSRIWNWIRGESTFKALVKEAFQENPSLWNALEVNRQNRLPTAENQMAVFNTEESMESVCKKTKGFCWGHATMKMFVTNLAFYDPSLKFSSMPPSAEGSLPWRRFYAAKIQSMLQGNPEVIPGFANLYDFSSHPQLQDYFKAAAVQSWADHAARPSSLPMFISQSDYTAADSVRFLTEVQSRIQQGYNPKIIFDENNNKLVEGEQNSIHVVLALATYPLKNNKTAILIWDDKKPYPDAHDVLILNHNSGKGFFWSWRWQSQGDGIDMGGGLINQYRIAPENDSEIKAIAYRLNDFCKNNPILCQELGRNQEIQPKRPVLPIPGKPWNPFEYAD